MMSSTPFLRLLREDMMRRGLDFARRDQQIGCGHQAYELRHQQAAAFHVVVDPHVPVSCRLGDDCINDVFPQSKKIVPDHGSLPLHADLTCNTRRNLRGNAKQHTSDGYIFAIYREQAGTTSPFINDWINETPNQHSDQHQRHAEPCAAADAGEAIHRGIS